MRTVDLIQRKRGTIHIDGPLPGALGDPERIGQVLTNLVMNALQAMKRPGTVHVRAEEVRDLIIKRMTYHPALEGMRLHLTAKEPGPGGIRLRPVSLEVDYLEQPLAERLFTTYLLPFELTSVLLLVAVVGGIATSLLAMSAVFAARTRLSVRS